jgi:hypothetical protein
MDGNDHGRIQTIDHEEVIGEDDMYGGVVNSDYGNEDGHDDFGDKVEVNLDELDDEDSDQESLLGRGNGNLNMDSGSTGESGGTSTSLNKFAVKESNDKGLADMETGSEVYMSELLAGFDMDDFDEAEE